MTAVALRIITRVIKRRVDAGEEFDEIVLDYPKLTEAEIEQIRAEVVPVDEPEEEQPEETEPTAEETEQPEPQEEPAEQEEPSGEGQPEELTENADNI